MSFRKFIRNFRQVTRSFDRQFDWQLYSKSVDSAKQIWNVGMLSLARDLCLISVSNEDRMCQQSFPRLITTLRWKTLMKDTCRDTCFGYLSRRGRITKGGHYLNEQPVQISSGYRFIRLVLRHYAAQRIEMKEMRGEPKAVRVEGREIGTVVVQLHLIDGEPAARTRNPFGRCDIAGQPRDALNHSRVPSPREHGFFERTRRTGKIQ